MCKKPDLIEKRSYNKKTRTTILTCDQIKQNDSRQVRVEGHIELEQ